MSRDLFPEFLCSCFNTRGREKRHLEHIKGILSRKNGAQKKKKKGATWASVFWVSVGVPPPPFENQKMRPDLFLRVTFFLAFFVCC